MMKFPTMIAVSLSLLVVAVVAAGAAVEVPASELVENKVRQQSSGQCEGLNSQRPRLDSISDAQWGLFVDAMNALKDNGEYARFVQIHSDQTEYAHGGNFLLPLVSQFLIKRI